MDIIGDMMIEVGIMIVTAVAGVSIMQKCNETRNWYDFVHKYIEFDDRYTNFFDNLLMKGKLCAKVSRIETISKQVVPAVEVCYSYKIVPAVGVHYYYPFLDLDNNNPNIVAKDYEEFDHTLKYYIGLEKVQRLHDGEIKYYYKLFYLNTKSGESSYEKINEILPMEAVGEVQ